MNAPTINKAAALQKSLAMAGWEIARVDISFVGDAPKAEIKIERADGRWVLGSVDGQGRARLDRFHRDRTLALTSGISGPRPLTPHVEDTFLGRQKCEGPQAMLDALTDYVVDNALGPVRPQQIREALAAVISGSLRLSA